METETGVARTEIKRIRLIKECVVWSDKDIVTKFRKPHEVTKIKNINTEGGDENYQHVAQEFYRLFGNEHRPYVIASNGVLDSTENLWEKVGRRYDLRGIKSLIAGNSGCIFVIDERAARIAGINTDDFTLTKSLEALSQTA